MQEESQSSGSQEEGILKVDVSVHLLDIVLPTQVW